MNLLFISTSLAVLIFPVTGLSFYFHSHKVIYPVYVDQASHAFCYDPNNQITADQFSQGECDELLFEHDNSEAYVENNDKIYFTTDQAKLQQAPSFTINSDNLLAVNDHVIFYGCDDHCIAVSETEHCVEKGALKSS
ncbi:hypothetical protein NEOLI_004872 [Neolecta irregularis DAH-3]|uniref:Uncharacterized protein n=1 Tax=Neolecta irregularis (strain DAH-3) TaxID=1198029 RepID=A0A1U7LUE3_NEOID|nr:hypothetical protein NEOLI_004872 [Neolecta irregularis DAH-3]|eukprot:OLL26162.1 hypothetical protein NEOLI_004872 [Neolecta irregularis DAH-3]